MPKPKPDAIQRLENALGLQLTDIAELPGHKKIIDWQAHIAAFDAGVENDATAFRNAALGRMKMSVSKNGYLADEQGRVLALNLFDNELEHFPFDQTADWEHLEVLFLAQNKLGAVHLPAVLPSLRWLDLSDNPDLHILRFDAALPALETLDASDSGLKQITFPAGFLSLKTLDLSRNQLTEVVLEGDCPRLEWLDLSGNGLETFRLPKGYGQLAYLYLNINKLKSLIFDAPLANLNTLHLRGNQLDDLPGNLYLFDKLESLYLHDNPLPQVPKGSSGVPEGEYDNAAVSIRNYLRSITEDTPMPIDEVKLVLLGNSTAGKSSLMRYLIEGVYDETIPSTHGISNILWDSKDLGFKVNIWDFGGQEFYHATHRLFLTENALSLVAFESATNKQGEAVLEIKIYENGQLTEKPLPVEVFPFTFWLENLQYFCGGRQTASLVQTKMDIGQPVHIDSAIKTNFHLPADTPRVSVKATFQKEKPFERKFEDFKDALFVALRQAKGKYPFSQKWLLIKNELRHLAEEKPLLHFDEYVAFCEKLRPGIHDKKSGQEYSMLDTLTDYLHETGVILYFRTIPELHDKVFIRPDWVTDAIYRVLDYEVMRNNGQFNRNHVEAVLTGFDADDLIRIMEKFEIIFPVSSKPGSYVAPQYLSDQDPLKKEEGAYFYQQNAKKCHETLLTLRFPHFLPRSVLTRFMSQYGPLAKETYWKNGIQFFKDDSWIWVERENNLDIAVRADKPSPVLTREFFDVFCRILGGAPSGEVSTAGTSQGKINPAVQVSTDGKHFVTMARLFRHPGKTALPKIETVSGEYVDIDACGLEALLSLTVKSMEDAKKPKIFISYAHADGEEYVKKIKRHLGALVQRNLIAPWDDRMLSAGKWSPQIEEALESADIFILLLTPGVLESEYINTVEIKKAYNRHIADGVKIFPVLCEYCGWTDIPLSDEKVENPDKKSGKGVLLGDFQVYPTNNTPIKGWDDENKALLNVIESLKKEIS